MADKQTPKALNDALIDALKRRGELAEARLEAAFRAVPRHVFLPDASLEEAYQDDAIPIKRDTDGAIVSSCSQPTMIAAMLAQMRLRPGDNILEIGAGTGYSAALMQHLVGAQGKITSIEIDHDLARTAQDSLLRVGLANTVTIVHADGSAGYAPRASYDRIVATAAVWDIPPAWIHQLKPSGILVAPVWLDAIQICAAFRVQPDGTLYSEINIPCGFVALRGPASGPHLRKRLGTTPLVLVSNHIDALDSAALTMLFSEDAEIGYLDRKVTAHDYWAGFLPYLMLHVPEGQTFALYNLISDQPAFGIEGHGFALIAPGSACFVPFEGQGKVNCFAGSDAFIALQDVYAAWERDGHPRTERLRIRLTPKTQGTASIPGGRVYERPFHNIHVWFERGSTP